MARTIMTANYGCSREVAEKKAAYILTMEGYCEAEQNGEMIWTSGGMKLLGIPSIKVDFEPDSIKLSGWIKSIIGGETPLHGIASAVTRRDVKETMDKLMSALSPNEN